MIGTRIGIYSGKNNFTGMLDLLNSIPEVGFSIRRLTRISWVTDDVIFRLRRSSDDAEADFSYSESNCVDGDSIALNATSGGGDNLTTWAGVDTLYIVEWYNQGSLGGYGSQSTTTGQPIFDLATLSILTNGGYLVTSTELADYPTPVDTIERMASFVMKFLPSLGSNGTRSYPLFFSNLTPLPSYEGSYDIRYVNTSSSRYYLKYTGLTSGGGVAVTVSGINTSNLVVAAAYLINAGSNNAKVSFNTTEAATTWSTANPSVFRVSNIFNIGTITSFLYECPEIIWASYYDSADYAIIKSNQTTYYGI